MSFWSSLVLARLAPPPVVTVGAMGAFVRGLSATGALVGGEEPVCPVKYGPRVDADERTTDETESDESDTLGAVGEYPWDMSETFPSVVDLAGALAADGRSVYRAFLSLGQLHPDIVAALTREPSEENDVGLRLSSLSFEVGPVLVAGLES